jgi:photosynthetic reaction center cytochrome c subunit
MSRSCAASLWSHKSVLFVVAFFAATMASANAQSGPPTNPAQTSAAPGPKKAEEVFKNIQVLKGVPADQLIPAMQFITASLGVECDYCHVQGAFDKDEKKPKEMARKMMQMMFTINKENFEGHREVTCYSCHRGAAKPIGIPAISDEEKPVAEGSGTSGSDSAANLPAPDQILEKYIHALGGGDAIQKVSSRVERGTMTAPGGRQFPIDIFTKGPDKRASYMHLPNGDSITAFDGKQGWLGAPGRPVREMSGSDVEAAKQDADLAFALHIKQMFSEMHAGHPERIGDRQANLVVASNPGQAPVRLYFDEQSGLLVRLVRYAESPLGRNPTRIDYADYRDEAGTKVPFRWTIARPGGRFTIQVEKIEENVAVDDAKFGKPAEAPVKPAQ